MTDYTVKQSGGDYSTLDAAIGGASVVGISIEGTWSVDDTQFVTVDVAGITVTCDTDSAHPGYIVASSPTHYRLRNNSSYSFYVTQDFTIDGPAIENQSTGKSAECFRIDAVDVDLVVKNVVGGFTSNVSEQDFVYINDRADCTVLLEQCHVWNVERGLVDLFNGTPLTVTVNSCHVYNLGDSGRHDTEGRGGIIGAQINSGTINFTCRNSLFHFDATASYTFAIDTSSGTRLVDQCITSEDGWEGGNADPTVTDSAVSHTWATTDQGAGNYVIIEGVEDLRLQDLGNAKNEAQDRHSVETDESVTIPSTDIVGTSRPQNTDYDLGAFEISAGGEERTASGALTSAVAVVAGAATKISNASGALTSEVATVAGAATRISNASGSLTSADATISGAATKGAKTASGALQSAASTVSGAATRVSNASGTLASAAATVAGTASKEEVKTASGTLQSADSTVAGAATKTANASGALQSDTATVAGAASKGTVAKTASGTLAASTATVAGAATRQADASGALQSADAIIAGTAIRTANASGALQSGDATVSGDATIGDKTASGALQAGDATVAGTVTRISVASGALTSADATVAGTVSRILSASGALQAGAATVTGNLGLEGLSVAHGSLQSASATVAGTATAGETIYVYDDCHTITIPVIDRTITISAIDRTITIECEAD